MAEADEYEKREPRNYEKEILSLYDVTKSVNKFAITFLKNVVTRNPRNMILSPGTAAIILAMAGFGTCGETQTEFKNVLRQTYTDVVAHIGYEALIRKLKDVRGDPFFLANKLFLTKGCIMIPSYHVLTNKYFHSAIELIDFANNEEAAGIINSWIEKSTGNHVTNMISADDLSDRTSIILVNAVYFNGQWENKFDPELTRERPFHINKDTIRTVPTMLRLSNYRYGELPEINAKFALITYKLKQLRLVIIVPNEIDGLPQVVEKLKDVSLDYFLLRSFMRNVHVYLPKCIVESEIEYNHVLPEMGLTHAFNNSANFSQISATEALKINKIVQKVVIQFSEEGIETAGSISSTGVQACRGKSHFRPVDLKVDRPSYIMLFHIDADFLLMNGIITDP